MDSKIKSLINQITPQIDTTILTSFCGVIKEVNKL